MTSANPARVARARLPLATVLEARLLLIAAGLILLELVVAGVLAANIAVYVLGLTVLLAGAAVVLRRPIVMSYIAFLWVLLEKSLGGYVPHLADTFTTVGNGLLVLGLCLALAVNLLRRERPVIRFGPVLLGAVAFILLGIASGIANGVPASVTGLGILDSVRSLLMFLIVINIGLSAKDVAKALYWLIGIMAVSSLVGLLQIWGHSPFWKLGGLRLTASHGLMRVDGLFDHPLTLGDNLALILPIAILLLTMGNVTGTARTWLKAAVGIMLAALIFTFAREAWLAVPVSIILVGLMVERKLVKAALVPAGLLALIAAPVVLTVNASDSGAQRLELLKISLPLIQSHWLIGVGPGRWGGHVALVTNTPLYAQHQVSNFFYGTGNQIDQFWTHLLTESGVLGVAAFLLMIVAVFLVGRRGFRASDDPRHRALMLGLLCAVPTAIILSLVSSVLEEGPASVLFWGLMGALVILAWDAEARQALRDSTAQIEGTGREPAEALDRVA